MLWLEDLKVFTCFYQMAVLLSTPPFVCSLSHLSPFNSLPFAEADGAEPNSSKLLGLPLIEEPQQRLKWQAHLEFTHNHDVGDLTWDKIEVTLPHSDKLRSLVLAGIPHSMRPQVRDSGLTFLPVGRDRIEATLSWLRRCQAVAFLGWFSDSYCCSLSPQLWMRLSGALQKKRNSEMSYRDIVKNCSNDETIAAKQVRDAA